MMVIPLASLALFFESLSANKDIIARESSEYLKVGRGAASFLLLVGLFFWWFVVVGTRACCWVLSLGRRSAMGRSLMQICAFL